MFVEMVTALNYEMAVVFIIVLVAILTIKYFENYTLSVIVFSKTTSLRLLKIAPSYYNLKNFPNCEAKRQLEKMVQRMK